VGILKEPAEMVRALPLPTSFSVCELGDQWMSGKVATLAADWYSDLGCGRYVSIDANGKGTHTADLNLPVAYLKLGQFDLVTDFGTGEHIFDQAQVWRTIHELTKPGGFIAFDRPSAGYDQHCFYTVHRTLLEDLAAANHYSIAHLSPAVTPRGQLIRGVFQRPTTAFGFRVPQQGRYASSLRLRVTA
jgi:SAM-dependent methyltransferase